MGSDMTAYRRCLRRFLGAFVLLGGCAEPFTVERHVLGPPRLAALGVQEGVARAAIWSGEGAFHRESPELEWSLDGAFLGEGFEVEVPGEGVLELRAQLSGGLELEGEVTVGPWATLDVLRAEVERPSGRALSLADRRAVVEPVPVGGSVPSTSMLRLIAARSPATSETMRWMLGTERWSLLELSPQTADVVAARVDFEDGQIESVADAAGGLAPGLALSVDGEGGNGWQWFDVAFDVDEPLLRVGGRLLRAGPDADLLLDRPGHVLATLVADPEAQGQAGFALEEVQPGGDLETDRAAWPLPSCGSGRLLDDIAEGRCPLDAIDGARVVLEVR